MGATPDVVESGPLHHEMPWRVEAVLDTQIVAQQVLVLDAATIERKNFGEERPADLVAALGEGSDHAGRRSGICEFGRFDDRANVIVRKGHNLFCGPEIVVGLPAHECRIRIIGCPKVRME